MYHGDFTHGRIIRVATDAPRPFVIPDLQCPVRFAIRATVLETGGTVKSNAWRPDCHSHVQRSSVTANEQPGVTNDSSQLW